MEDTIDVRENFDLNAINRSFDEESNSNNSSENEPNETKRSEKSGNNLALYLCIALLSILMTGANIFCIFYYDMFDCWFIFPSSIPVFLLFSAYYLFKMLMCYQKFRDFICNIHFLHAIHEYSPCSQGEESKSVKEMVISSFYHELGKDESNISFIKKLNILYREYCDTYGNEITTYLIIFIAVLNICILFISFLHFQKEFSTTFTINEIVMFTIVFYIDMIIILTLLFNILTVLIWVVTHILYIISYKKLHSNIIVAFTMSLVAGYWFDTAFPNKSNFIIPFILCHLSLSLVIAIIVYFAIRIVLFIKNCTFINDDTRRTKINVKELFITIAVKSAIIVGVVLIVIASCFYFTVNKLKGEEETNTFGTIENQKEYNNMESFCSFEKHISQLTFGIGTSDYMRGEYAKPSIITPTVDLSDYFEIESSSKDYYRLTSSSLPMNGVVYYPLNIKSQKNQSTGIVIILSNQMNNLVESDLGYKYLQESLAENGIVAISLDHTFLDVDDKGKSVESLIGLDKKETYLSARALLTVKTIQYLSVRLNSFFSGKLNFNNIGLIGDREGGGVAMRVIQYIHNNMTFISDIAVNKTETNHDEINQHNYGVNYNEATSTSNNTKINITSIFIMSCKDSISSSLIQNTSSYFIETVDDITVYSQPLLSSYYYFDKKEKHYRQEYDYSGSLFIEKGISNYYNSKYKEKDSQYLRDSLYNNKSSYLKNKSFRCIVTNYATAHFLCAIKTDCKYIDILKDFKRGKSILPQNSGYYNVFESSRDIDLYSNGSTYNCTIESNANYEGLYFQNVFLSTSKLYHCYDNDNCIITIKLTNTITANGISLLFYRNDVSEEYDQYIEIFSEDNERYVLNRFKYSKLRHSSNDNDISDVFLFQTYLFDFPVQNVSVSRIHIHFKGEIIVDCISLYY